MIRYRSDDLGKLSAGTGTTTTGSSTTLHTTTTKLRITTVAATGFSLCLILHSSIWPHSITEMICQCRE
ncbi:unnamed protein product [Brassica oleracea var. botrytis]